MPSFTRRGFLQSVSATLLFSSVFPGSERLLASPFGLPIGLQLYSVRDMLAKAYEGTLKQVAALGFQEVEAAGFFGHTPQQVKQAMQAAGVKGGVKGSHCGGVKVVQWKVRNCGENGVWSVAEDGILPAVRSAGGC